MGTIPDCPPELLRLFLPDLFGRSEDAYGGSETPAESFPVYAGLFPALLALYGLLFLRGRHLLPAQLGLLLIPLVVCNTPAIWLHRLLLGNIPLQYSRLAFLLPLPLALLAAHTAAHLARQPRRWLAFLLFAFAVAFLLAAAAGSLPLADGSMRPLGRTVALRHALTVLLAGVPCLLLLAGGSRQRRGLAFALLVIITVGDCWTAVAPHAHPGWPFLIPPERVWPAPSGIPAAAGAVPHTGRVLPERPELFGAQVAVHGLFSSTGYDNFVPPRIGALYAWPHGYSRAAGRSLTPRSLRAQQLAATAWHLLPDGMAPVPGSLPRLAGFRDVLVVPDDRQALSLLMADTFPYQRLVVLAEPPAHPLTATRWSTRLTAESSNRVTCQSESNGFFLLLLNDTLAPGWEVLIDESDALLLRANTAFRACTVPPGRHIITFVYHAPGLRAGSLITVATCLGLLFWLCRNRR